MNWTLQRFIQELANRTGLKILDEIESVGVPSPVGLKDCRVNIKAYNPDESVGSLQLCFDKNNFKETIENVKATLQTHIFQTAKSESLSTLIDEVNAAAEAV